MKPNTRPLLTCGASVANASCVRTQAAVAGKLNYANGFDLWIGGATAGSLIEVTLAGLEGGTCTYVVAVPAGVTLDKTVNCRFPCSIPASGPNVALTLTVPAAGAGNTKVNACLYGERTI